MAPISSESAVWTEVIEAEFIDLVKDKRNLWDPQHKFYANSRLKQCDYKDIAKTLGSKWPEHASLFTLSNLTAKFSSIKSQYKTEWINKKDEKIKEETSVPESDHYQHLSFLEAIISKEVEESDDLKNVSLNSSCEISETNENLESTLIGNVIMKTKVDDSFEAETSKSSPNIIHLMSEDNVVTLNDDNVEKNDKITTRMLEQETPSTSPDCKTLYVKALETVKEVASRINSVPCICSSNADVAFGHYIGSHLANIPNSQMKETLKVKLMEVLSKAKYRNRITEKYAVVRLENEIQLVPICWLTEDESHCYWPNCTSLSRINTMIEKLTEPDKRNWSLFKVLSILETFYEYEKGLEKMKECVNDAVTSKSNKRKRHQYSEDSSSDELYIEKNLTSKEDFLSLSDEPSQKKKGSLSDTMEVVLQTLNSISTRLSILEDPAYLNKSDAVEMDPAVISDIMKIFPISSDEQMDDLEFFLSQEENEKLMINALKVIGGSGDYQLITNVLKRCISDGVGELYSFLGAKQKNAFKSLRFSSVIFQCVRYHSRTITEDKYASVVASWLRHAKARRERHDKISNALERAKKR